MYAGTQNLDIKNLSQAQWHTPWRGHSHVWGELKQSSQSHGNARLKERQRDTDDLVQQLAVEVKSLRRQIVHNDEQQCARINPLLDDFNARATSIHVSRAREV